MRDSIKITTKEKEYWENKEEFDWMPKKGILEILRKIPRPWGHVVELCAGSGMFTRYVDFRNCNTYTCLDISQRLLDKLKFSLPQVNILLGDAQNLNFKEKSIDCVYIYAGLHHLPRLDSCLLGSYKILKAEGKFICFEPNADCFYRFIMLKLRGLLGLYTEDEVFLNPLAITGKLNSIGFKNVKIKYVTPSYKLKHIGILYPLFIIMKLIALLPGRRFQSFFIITCEK
ncbi:class I SAM-dependent methyltransferase [Candidatus Woesearchaeota archaeon]|nr:class I SAM-dependent methyltransferase [Candidatus Woesearchaeota archaeon]